MQLNWYRAQLKDFTIREYLCFMLFPPTLASGPIETAHSFRKARIERITADDVGYGVLRIAIGVAKKVFIANMLLAGIVDDNIFQVAADPMTVEGQRILLLLFGSFLFAYVDFSAYSDIAIGAGRLFGYRSNPMGVMNNVG